MEKFQFGEKDVMDLAERFQNECHAQAEYVIHLNPKISSQDATNVWLFKKIAEMQLVINALNSEIYK